jgi:transcriptional regulator with XRE-family HTH domain
MNRREVAALVEEIGPGAAARLCGVHRTTVGRWLSGKVAPPPSALDLLRIAASGQVPGMGGDWLGWRFAAGRLWSPNGVPYSPGDLMAQQYERPLIRALQRKVSELEARIVRMTKAAAQVDPAGNDSAIWPTDPAARAFSGG